MKKISYILFLLFLLINSVKVFSTEVLSNRMIWQGEKYAAFTSLVYYKGYFYCAFRNANKHVDSTGEDCGIIKIIRSKNSDKWEEFLSFKEDGYDLRDPQLSITPDNKIMLLTERVLYKEGKALSRQTCTSFIQRKGKHTPLTPIVFPNLSSVQNRNWIWNVEWIDGIAYGFTYVPYFALFKSEDGVNWQLIHRINIEDNPTEASLIRLDENRLLAVVKRDINALVGVFDFKSSVWQWFDSGEKVACPKIINIDGKYFVLGRSYDKESQTTIYELVGESFSLKKIHSIEGKRDCAYPGVIYRKGIMYVTYYSGDGVNSDIYLALIRN